MFKVALILRKLKYLKLNSDLASLLTFYIPNWRSGDSEMFSQEGMAANLQWGKPGLSEDYI